MYTIYIKEKRYQTLTLLPNCRLHLTLGTLQVPDTPHFSFVLWASHHQTDSGGGGGGGLRVVLCDAMFLEGFMHRSASQGGQDSTSKP